MCETRQYVKYFNFFDISMQEKGEKGRRFELVKYFNLNGSEYETNLIIIILFCFNETNLIIDTNFRKEKNQGTNTGHS